jgi:tetratricopeptide (TPR) repeat protein
MNPYLQLLTWVIVLAVLGLIIWYREDMRSILGWTRDKNRLSLDGRWDELEEHFKRAEKNRRPFVWFHRKYLNPGNLQTQYALFLFNLGRLEEALSKVDEAARRIEAKPWIFQSYFSSGTRTTRRGSLRTRILILSGMGRYDEARQAGAELQKFEGTGGKPVSALALLEFYCGHLDEALAIAEKAAPEDSQDDSMRGIAALCHSIKGDYHLALRALSYEPTDVTKFYSDSGMQLMNASPEGSELLALKQLKLAGIFPPARWIKLAQVHIASKDFASADHALDRAEKSLGPEPGLRAGYHRCRARSFAEQGKGPEAEKHLEHLRVIVKERPKRGLLWELHYTAGQSYLNLNRLNEALAQLQEAQKWLLHPIEKHSTNFWMAKAHEALGNQSEAIRYYQMVADDPIPSKIRNEALEKIAVSQRS